MTACFHVQPMVVVDVVRLGVEGGRKICSALFKLLTEPVHYYQQISVFTTSEKVLAMALHPGLRAECHHMVLKSGSANCLLQQPGRAGLCVDFIPFTA